MYEIPGFLMSIFTVLYYLAAVVCIVGNLLIITVVVKNRNMRSVTNYFIANLALVDIVISVLSTPLQFKAAMLQFWPWPHPLCKLAPFATSLNINVSVSTLATISLDRFYVIFFPLKPKLRPKHFVFIMCVIWIVALSIASYNLVTYEVHNYTNSQNETVYVCAFTDSELSKYYFTCEVIVQFVIPLVLISFSCIAISLKVNYPGNVVLISQVKKNCRNKSVSNLLI
jgi:hypothetical protein